MKYHKIYNKGTWDLPKKITRNFAERLLATSQYTKDASESHTKKHCKLCKEMERIKKRTKETAIC